MAGVSKILRIVVGGSTPGSVLVFVVIVMMLMLSVFVINHLGRVSIFQIQPKPCSVDQQAEDRDTEELQLQVGGDELKQQAEFSFEQHNHTKQFLQVLLLLLSKFLSSSFF